MFFKYYTISTTIKGISDLMFLAKLHQHLAIQSPCLFINSVTPITVPAKSVTSCAITIFLLNKWSLFTDREIWLFLQSVIQFFTSASRSVLFAICLQRQYLFFSSFFNSSTCVLHSRIIFLVPKWNKMPFWYPITILQYILQYISHIHSQYLDCLIHCSSSNTFINIAILQPNNF